MRYAPQEHDGTFLKCLVPGNLRLASLCKQYVETAQFSTGFPEPSLLDHIDVMCTFSLHWSAHFISVAFLLDD